VIVANEASRDLSIIDSDLLSETFNHVVATVKTGKTTKTVTVAPDGGRIYVGTDDGYLVLGSLDYGVVATVTTGKTTKTVTVTPDGSLLILLDTLGDVYIFDVAEGSNRENQVVATVKSSSGSKSVTVSPDGALLFLVQEEGNIILVLSLDVGSSVSVITHPDATVPPVELQVLYTLTAGENPEMVVFDPTGSGTFYVPNSGDETVSVFGTPTGPAVLAGIVSGDCPTAGSPLPGAEVDVYEVGTGELVAALETDTTGYYTSELEPGDYTVTIVTPLSYTILDEETPVTMEAEQTVIVDWPLHCEEIVPDQRKMSFWKHQLGVALRGEGKFEIDGPTLCSYLDIIEARFNNHRMNPVVVYQPPASGECLDKLQVTKDLLNLDGDEDMLAHARQELMALLLNVSGGKLALHTIISEDDMKVSKAITYVDRLIDIGGDENAEIAMKIAKDINKGKLVTAGVILGDLPDIAYEPKVFKFGLEQNHPNPFNPTTTIHYEVAQTVHVRLKVYDVAGRLVATLVDGTRTPERYKVDWHGINDGGQSVATGVYFYKLEAGSYVKTRKLLLLK
jgi:DNA-binding beta-propeller fold protein YncE